MKREQKEIKLRMILQDYHRRNDYELQQAVNDILALDALPPAEGAEEIIDDAETILHSHPYLKVWTETLFDSEMKVCSIEQALWAIEKAATLHAQKIADKMVSERLRETTERCKKLEFMIDKGLGWDDMKNDITMPHEL
jgi:hypothetical protein